MSDTESEATASDSVSDEILASYQERFKAVAARCGLAGAALLLDWRSDWSRATNIWATQYSWKRCGSCRRRSVAPITPAIFNALRQSREPNLKPWTCTSCAKGTGYSSPTWADIPECLRDLKTDEREILRPLHVNLKYKRARFGYRIRQGPFWLSWKKELVSDRLDKLSTEQQSRLRPIYEFLVQNVDSTYNIWITGHEHFLAKDDLSSKARRLPLDVSYRATRFGNSGWGKARRRSLTF